MTQLHVNSTAVPAFPPFLTGIKWGDDRLKCDWPVVAKQEHFEEARRAMNGDGGPVFELSAERKSRSRSYR
jgi:hypothetical protein